MTALGNTSVRRGFFIISFMVLTLLFLHNFKIANSADLFNIYWHFFFVGILAATIANASGAGGGIIFLPAFSLLGLTTEQALATSFAIQCFGMTSGSLAWLGLVRAEYGSNPVWHSLNKILLLALPGSLAGLLVTQLFIGQSLFNVHQLFSVFSILVGSLILYRSVHYKESETKIQIPSGIQSVSIILSCFIGGMITAWLSIGVGEILVIVLLMMKYNVRLAVAAGVCVSSATVLVAIFFHTDSVHYAVLQFSAPAALIGGFVARYLAMMVSPLRLKIMLSLWIILSGFVYLYVN